MFHQLQFTATCARRTISSRRKCLLTRCDSQPAVSKQMITARNWRDGRGWGRIGRCRLATAFHGGKTDYVNSTGGLPRQKAVPPKPEASDDIFSRLDELAAEEEAAEAAARGSSKLKKSMVGAGVTDAGPSESMPQPATVTVGALSHDGGNPHAHESRNELVYGMATGGLVAFDCVCGLLSSP